MSIGIDRDVCIGLIKRRRRALVARPVLLVPAVDLGSWPMWFGERLGWGSRFRGVCLRPPRVVSGQPARFRRALTRRLESQNKASRPLSQRLLRGSGSRA